LRSAGGPTCRAVTPTWHNSVEDVGRTSSDPESLKWFGFYVAGDISGLQIDSVQAFDSNGGPVTGITAMRQ